MSLYNTETLEQHPVNFSERGDSDSNNLRITVANADSRGLDASL